LVFLIGKLTKNLVQTPKNIIFCITMMKTLYYIHKESVYLKQFTENSRKKRRLGLFVQRVNDRLRRLIKRKAI